MLLKTMIWLACSLVVSSGIAWGQCGCQQCGRSIWGQPGCGSSRDWDQPFYDCCEPSIGDYQICDPCCRLPYFSAYAGYNAADNLSRTFALPTTVNVITDIFNPGPPVTDIFVAETTDVVREQVIDVLDGFVAGGTVGYRVHPQARLEAEFAYRENEVSGLTLYEDTTITRFTDRGLTNGVVINNFQAAGGIAATGTIRSYAAMFNAVYELSYPRLKCMNLYGGGGMGVIYAVGDIDSVMDDYRISSASFAYQLIGGLNVPLTRRAEFFSEYKYLGADNLSVDDTTNNTTFGQVGLDSHNISAGIRFYLGR